MRKIIFLLTLFLISILTCAQNYIFARDFVPGIIYLKDTTVKRGLIKWEAGQSSRLLFKKTTDSEINRYMPKDLLGFQADKRKFVSLHDVEVCMDVFVLLGAKVKLKHVFGERLHAGPVNIYLVTATVYDQLYDRMKPYHNYVFEKQLDSSKQYVAYPLGLRMTAKKYEWAKKDLYKFFEGNAVIIERLRAYRDEEDDFMQIINLVKRETAVTATSPTPQLQGLK